MWLTLLLLACGDDDETKVLRDEDGDGVANVEDCAPDDPSGSPGRSEDAYDGLDNDCDPSTPDDDLDGDGFLRAADCADSDADRYPGATEICDDKDNDCDGAVDDEASDASTWWRDEDGDGYGDEDASYTGCEAPAGYAEQPGDCDDDDDAVHPGRSEVCANGVDDDCDGNSESDDGICAFEGFMFADEAADAWLYGSAVDESCGYAVSGVGDLDGDGDEEALIGCPGQIVDGAWQGQVWLEEGPVYGERSLGGADAGFHVDQDHASLGERLGPAPDLDGDGFGGVWMGASGMDSHGGAALVYQAPLSGDLDELDADLWISGTGADDGPTTSVSDLAWPGDWDGDGVEDIVVGSGGINDVSHTADAHAWLLSGPLSGAMNVSDATTRFTADLGDGYDTPGWFEDGTRVCALEGADGVSGLLIAQPRADGNGVDSGAIYLVTAAATGEQDLTDGAADGVWVGERAGDWAGYGGASTGDLDGDGYTDLLIAAPGVDGDGIDQGALYVELSPWTTDGLVRNLSDADIRLSTTRQYAGWHHAIVPDVSGDEAPDLLIAADAGAPLVWLVEGPLEAGAWDLDDLAGATIWGTTDPPERRVESVGASDTDGDGIADVLLGHYNNDLEANDNRGGVFVLLGRPGY